jgi:methyl-accepting chemotaxis protein
MGRLTPGLEDQSGSTEQAKWNLWHWLVEPSSSVQAPDARRQVRLFLSLLVLIIPIFIAGTIAVLPQEPENRRIALMLGGAAVVFSLAYGLGRTKSYRRGIYLALGCFSSLPVVGLLLMGVYDSHMITLAFMWSIAPVMVGSILLSYRRLVFLAVLPVLLLLSLPVLIREVVLGDIASILSFVILIGALILVVTRNQSRLEEDRRAELLKSNSRLRDTQEALEERNEYLRLTVKGYDDFMSEVASGDLSTRLAVDESTSQADDPLVTLGKSLDETVDGLGSMITQIRETAQDLNSAAKEILASTTQQASGASEQSAAIAQTTTTVDEVKIIAEQSVTRAQEVAHASQRTVEVSLSGQQAVEETIASMAQIKARVEAIAENTLALSEQTQQIGEIIATVNEIAAQSNILALNASVEAARAGEYGKGFAVVAAEVRSLAEQSRQATAQVKGILSDIQKATNATVMATEEGTKDVEEGVHLAAQTSEAIQQLAGVIEEATQAAAQMVAGGRQQAAGVEQVAVAMQNINQATVQSLSSTRQTEKAAQELNDLARNLMDVVTRYQL